MLYHPDGRSVVVATPEEHDRLASEDWGTVPQDIHRMPAVTASPILSGGDPLALMIREVLESVLDERGIGRRRR
jgi:hypothetical protein